MGGADGGSSTGTGGTDGGAVFPPEECTNMLDDDFDGAIDCMDTECAMDPMCLVSVTNVDYPVIAMGGTLIVTGRGFMNAAAVTIGGTNQPFVKNSDTQITIAKVSDATPLATRQLRVRTEMGGSASLRVTVIRLQINELDANQIGYDKEEFVEISTGVPNVNLNGYSLVAFSGAQADMSYMSIQLNGTTDANGLLLVGNANVVPPGGLTFGADTLQNGADAVGIFQSPASTFPSDSPATTNRLIDALVYSSGEGPDESLLDLFFGVMGTPQRVQVNETTTTSIQRCTHGRRDGRRFATGTPTPGAPNNVGCP